jgi:hypothetical protein
MTQLNGNHRTDIGTLYEAPAFAPGVAFAWTLRSAEIARRAEQRRSSQTPTFGAGVAFAWTLRSAELARERRRNLPSGAQRASVLAA